MLIILHMKADVGRFKTFLREIIRASAKRSAKPRAGAKGSLGDLGVGFERISTLLHIGQEIGQFHSILVINLLYFMWI
jgi:hypothetical protein